MMHELYYQPFLKTAIKQLKLTQEIVLSEIYELIDFTRNKTKK